MLVGDGPDTPIAQLTWPVALGPALRLAGVEMAATAGGFQHVQVIWADIAFLFGAKQMPSNVISIERDSQHKLTKLYLHLLNVALSEADASYNGQVRGGFVNRPGIVVSARQASSGASKFSPQFSTPRPLR
jgi:hypothetical protein